MNRYPEFNDPAFQKLSNALKQFEIFSTVSVLAGLLTMSEFQSAAMRIEVLLHLAVTNCGGKRIMKFEQMKKFLEIDLVRAGVYRFEDPVEDVFIGNVTTDRGNCRTIQGGWIADFQHTQDLLDCFAYTTWGQRYETQYKSVASLLQLSEFIVGRTGLPRWSKTTSQKVGEKFLSKKLDMDKIRSVPTVSFDELQLLGIPFKSLEAFFLSSIGRERIKSQNLCHTSLERAPILIAEDAIILACPTAIGPAIRRYLLAEVEKSRDLHSLAKLLRSRQVGELFRRSIPRIASAMNGKKEVGRLSKQETEHNWWDEASCEIDADKLAHIFYLPDSLEDMEKFGLSKWWSPSSEQWYRLQQRLAKLETSDMGPGSCGLVLFVFGGIGRAFGSLAWEIPRSWHVVTISAPDLFTFARANDTSLLRLWKLQQQVANLSARGIEIRESSGILNTYAFWEGRGFDLLPTDQLFDDEDNTVIAIFPDYEFELRVAQRTSVDRHLGRYSNTHYVPVVRYSTNSYFPDMNQRPIYVAEEIDPRVELVGICELSWLQICVTIKNASPPARARDLLFHFWECLISWIDRILPLLLSKVERNSSVRCIRVEIDLAVPEMWSNWDNDLTTTAAFPDCAASVETYSVNLSIPVGFVTALRQPTNLAERRMLESTVAAILELLRPATTADPSDSGSALAESIVSDVMNGESARFIHMFDAVNPAQKLSKRTFGRNDLPRLVQVEDRVQAYAELVTTDIATELEGRLHVSLDEQDANALLGSDNALRRARNSYRSKSRSRHIEISGVSDCNWLLHKVVDRLWNTIQIRLEGLERESTVAFGLRQLELIIHDRTHWHNTSRALSSLFQTELGAEVVAAKRENSRAEASQATRVLVEMAVCAANGSKEITLEDYDILCARISALTMIASVSDAINYKLTDSHLEVDLRGRIRFDTEFLDTVVTPFALEFHYDEFRQASDSYEELYRSTPKTESGDPAKQTDDFAVMFREEYGILPSQVFNAVGELVDVAIEFDRLLVGSTVEELTDRLIRHRQFTRAETSAFFELLALKPRDSWNVAPQGFIQRDWYPWRFRRRLSLVSKPIVRCGGDSHSRVLYGVHQLVRGVSYLFENIQAGWFPTSHFRTGAMLEYWGIVVERLGAAFTQEVSARLQEMGWNTKTELQMKTLGAPKKMGDLDVVAWRSDSDALLLIECKRLQPSKTIGEIGEVLANFEGKTGDNLGKHLTRCTWARNNVAAIKNYLDLPANAPVIQPLVVTNRNVPMRFVATLPLDPQRIVPLARLSHALDMMLAGGA